MFKRKWFILVLLIVLVGIFFQYYQYSQDNLHKRIAESENTMMRTDAIRFSFRAVVMLQKGYISLTQSIADKDEDKFYDALDYIEAGQGFLHMEYIQNDKLVAKLNPLIEDIYNKIESFGLNITQKELDNIHTNLIFIEKEMELSEKDIWIEFQK
ncbi:MAG: hypothetical protein U9N02_06565, partial [Campylobacterota bacterium]|nr:hypothetical protein [Campylobacterota bacterium]